MDPKRDGDLGFSFRTIGGDVTILRSGAVVTVLRDEAARHFLAEMSDAPFSDQQQAMARLTGNYKRGNERVAANHPRNRR
jgi:hypothetical protein